MRRPAAEARLARSNVLERNLALEEMVETDRGVPAVPDDVDRRGIVQWRTMRLDQMQRLGAEIDAAIALRPSLCGCRSAAVALGPLLCGRRSATIALRPSLLPALLPSLWRSLRPSLQ